MGLSNEPGPDSVAGVSDLATDQHGHLCHADQWTRAWARKTAANDSIELDDDHWAVLEFLREYHEQYADIPPMRLLLRVMEAQLGERFGNSRHIYRLFPEGPARQGSRYAGLPLPESCL